MKTAQKPGGEALFLAVLLLGMGLLVTVGVLEMCATVARAKVLTREGFTKKNLHKN